MDITKDKLINDIADYNATLTEGEFREKGVDSYHDGLRSGHGYDDWLDLESAVGLINFILTKEFKKGMKGK